MLTRFIVSSVFFIVYALCPGTSFRLPKKEHFLRISVLALLGVCIYHLGVTFGEKTVSAGTTSMFIGAAPIFTSVISIVFLKERPSVVGWIGLLIGFMGIFIITLGTGDGAFNISTGAILILISSISISLFFVLQKPLLHIYKPVELIAYVTWIGTIPFFIFSPGVIQTVQNATLEANLSTIYVGIFPAAIGYVTWASALSLGKASTISSFMYIEPVVAIIVAWIWLGELPSALSVLGGIIAISSIVIVGLFGRKNSIRRG